MNSAEELVRMLNIMNGNTEEESDEFDFDDLMEHDHEDLEQKFGLDKNDTHVLWMNIQAMRSQFQDVYRLDARDPIISRTFLENLQEDIHGGFYGDWSDYQRYVIQAWIFDLGEGCRDALKYEEYEQSPYKKVIGDGRQGE